MDEIIIRALTAEDALTAMPNVPTAARAAITIFFISFSSLVVIVCLF